MRERLKKVLRFMEDPYVVDRVSWISLIISAAVCVANIVMLIAEIKAKY